MSEDFTHQVLRMVVARICQPLGVHGMQNSVCDTLADVLRNYLLTLGKTTAAYSRHANRTDPTLGDLQQAFGDLGVHLSDLSEFTREVESLSLVHRVPLYPVPRNSTHIHQPPPGSESLTRHSRRGSLSSEDESDKELIPPYLPPLPSKKVDNKDEAMQEEVQNVPTTETVTETVEAVEPTVPGNILDPLKGLPQLSRARGFSSDFSEEGDGGSRRNSICEWASIGTGPLESGSMSKQAESGSNAKNEAALIGTSNIASRKQSVSEDVFVAPSSLVRTKAMTFEPAPTDQAKKLPEFQATDFKTQKNDGSSSSNQLGKVSPLVEVHVKRVQPPPLRLMSPSSGPTPESPNPVFPVQQPPLSPLSRSPLPQLTGRPRMPVLSPLRVPPRPHPLAGTQVISPSWKDVPPLRSPTEIFQPVTPIGAHQTSPPISQIGTSAFPISAHPSIQTKHTSPKQTDTIVQAPVATVTKQSSPIKSPEPKHESFSKTQYKLPKSPETIALKDFNVVTERISISGRRVSKSLSKSRSPTPPVVHSPSAPLPLASQQEREDIEALKVEQDLSLSPSEDEEEDGESVTSERSHHDSVTSPQAIDTKELEITKQTSSENVDDVELNSPVPRSPMKTNSPSQPSPPIAAPIDEVEDSKNISHLSDISSDEFEDVEEPLDAATAEENEADSDDDQDEMSPVVSRQDNKVDGESVYKSTEELQAQRKEERTMIDDERKIESAISSPYTEPEQFDSPLPASELPSSPIPDEQASPPSQPISPPGHIPEPVTPPTGHIPDLDASSPGQITEPELPSSPISGSEQDRDRIEDASPQKSDTEDEESTSFQAVAIGNQDEHSKSRSSSPSLVSDIEHGSKEVEDNEEEDEDLVFNQNSNLETPFGNSDDQVMNIHEVVETIVEKDSVQLVEEGGGAGVSDDVLEILGQALSSDDSEEESGEDMIETTSALPEPQVIVTTEQVKGRGRKVSRDELFGIKKEKKQTSKQSLKSSSKQKQTKPPPPAPSSSNLHLSPSSQRHPQSSPLSLSLPVTIDRHLLSSLKSEPQVTLDRAVSTAKPSLLLTKAEMKVEVSPSVSRPVGGSMLRVTSGPAHPVGLSPSPSSHVVPTAVPSGSRSHDLRGGSEEEMASQLVESLPLLITISRHLLRETRFGLTTPIDDRTKLPQATTAERVKMRLARFSSTLMTPPCPVGGALTLTTPTLNPRKRELDASEIDGGSDSVAKRQRMEEHQVYVNPPHQQLSSSSSSSSSDEDDSGSDSLSCTPSPPAPPSPFTTHPSYHTHSPPAPLPPFTIHPSHHTRSSSSGDDDDEPSTPASSASSTLSGKGLKLTISKALLKQATVQLRTGSGSGKRGGATRGGAASRPAKQAKGRKKAPKRTSLPSIPPPTVVAETKKTSGGGRRKQTPRGSKGDSVADRSTGGAGSKKSGSGLVIKSSKPIVLPPSSKPRVPRHSTTATPTHSHGSEYHCPECGLRDDGSPMIGCDGCDSWVHWTCAGVTREPPEDEKWYCSSCIARRGGAKGGKKGRKKRK